MARKKKPARKRGRKPLAIERVKTPAEVKAAGPVRIRPPSAEEVAAAEAKGFFPHRPSPEELRAEEEDDRDRGRRKMEHLGHRVFDRQIRGVTGGAGDDGSFINHLRATVKPRDAFEDMAIVEASWTHARYAHLSALACEATDIEGIRVLNEAADRCANSFRRQMLALAEYRRPPRADGFLALRQLNMLNMPGQQHMINHEPDSLLENRANEKGSTPTALPAHADWAGHAAGDDPPHEALASDAGAGDGSGKAAVEDERPQARRPRR